LKVGDLVKCSPVMGTGTEIGLIVERTVDWSLVVWRVLLKGKTYPFHADRLEVISESR